VISVAVAMEIEVVTIEVVTIDVLTTEVAIQPIDKIIDEQNHSAKHSLTLTEHPYIIDRSYLIDTEIVFFL